MCNYCSRLQNTEYRLRHWQRRPALAALFFCCIATKRNARKNKAVSLFALFDIKSYLHTILVCLAEFKRSFSRIRTHRVSRSVDGCGEQEDLRALVVTRRHTPPILKLAEYSLDAVASFVATLVGLDGLFAQFAAGNAGICPLAYKASRN